jgi:parvulin-like peptidyl-prolyl isomerase
MHALTFLLPAALAATLGDPVVARVDGEEIRASMLLAREARVKAVGGALPREQVLDAIVGDVLVARSARGTPAERSPAVQAALDSERRRLAADRFATREIEKMTPAEEQIRDLFHDTADVFRLRLATYTSPEAAAAGMSRLAAGGDFAEEAARSLDPRSAKNKGDLGTVTRRELGPALANAAAKAELGKPTGPVALPLGFAVIVVAERKLGDEASYQAMAPQLREFAKKQLQTGAKKHLARQLRAAYGVKLDEAFVKSTGNRLTATPQEAAHVVTQVKGRAIRWGDVLPEIARNAGSEGHMSGPAVKLEFAWVVVDRVLLEEEALARGFGDGPEADALLRDARSWLVAQEVAARLRSEVPAPSAGEIERWYAAHQAELARPARRACSGILLESRADAEAARKRIAAGERFEDVARELSVDADTRAQGGALGEIALSRMDELERAGEKAAARALKDAKAGQVVGPVSTRAGMQLFRCGPVLAAGAPPLADVRAEVAARARADAEAAALTGHLERLRKAARVSVDTVALASLAR